MDAFEPVRDSARKLHDEVVAAGADASHPLFLVEAAVRQLDLELAWLPLGDPVLKGARAVFDEQIGAICCADEGDERARAALVAHEIGHASVHSRSSECSAEDIDASRSTETVPVGLQRIEDYSGHERRELQANVFAREFLLPRAAARRLYLDERLSATSISGLLRLPSHLVRQQLLDALLLPASSSEPEASRRPERPDASQDRAAGHHSSAFQLQAGPGTGKTRTLVKKVLALLGKGTDPSSILVLTFSNRAAGELSERIAAASPDAASRIWIGTFHAFGLDIIRRYHDHLGLPPDPPLFDRSDAIGVLEEILPILPLVHYRNLWDPALVLRDIVTAISRAKDEAVRPAHYRGLAERMRDQAATQETQEAAEKTLEIAYVYDLYEHELRRRGAVDFGDLVMRPALLLEEDAVLQKVVQLRHRHVLVDEYQDVNRASARLLRAVAGDGRRLWVVGDSRQSIYRFRGASSTNVASFASDYPHAAPPEQLLLNYRSSEEIVGALVCIATHLGASMGMLPLNLTADRGSSGINPQVRRFDTLDQEAEGVAASVVELAEAGVRLRDQAVLCRSNARLNEISTVLESRGIPVLHLGSFFEREEIRDLLSLLSLAIDPFGDGLARVGAMSRYDLSLQDVRTATMRLRESGQPAATKLSNVIETGGLSERGARGLETLAKDLAGLRSASPWEFLTTYLLDRTDVIAKLATSNTAAACMRAVAIWQFLNFARDRSPSGSGPPIRRMLDRVRQLVLFAEERDLRQVPAAALHIDAVRLMTVHGSKGLEFEAVHVPGLTVSSFPSSHRGLRCPAPDGMVEGAGDVSAAEEAKSAHECEEECLFFVATSRARTHLRLYLARKQPNGKNRSASPYLDWIPTALLDAVPSPATLALPSHVRRQPPVTIAWPSGWHVTDASLRTYEKCPRRFFYTHILGLGGARKPTAFSRTHDCLYELIEWLAEARVEGEADKEAASAEFERLWQMKGPTDHAFAEDYRQLANRLVEALVRLGAGRRFRRSEPLAIDFVSGRILVEPDEIAQLSDGTVVLRRVRTGYKRSDEYNRLDYSLYHLAARERFKDGYQIEALHLTDQHVELVTISNQKIENRRIKSGDMLAEIAAGQFPPEIDAVVCPRCPHFFICAATPLGSLSLT